MLPLFFQDNGNVGPDIPGSSSGGQQEAGVRWHVNINRPGNGLQVPIAVCAGVAGNVDRTRDSVYLQVVFGPLDLDGAAGRGSLHTAARVSGANGTRGSADAHIAFDVGQHDIAGRALNAHNSPNTRGLNRPTRSRDLGVSLYTVNVYIARCRRSLDRAAHVVDSYPARRYTGVDFGIAGNFNFVLDGNVLQGIVVLADADDVVPLLDRGICSDVLNGLFRTAEHRPPGCHFTEDVHFTVGTAPNIHIA